MKTITALIMLFSCFSFFGQTDPTPQSLPMVQDFSTLAHSSTTYPTGFQGWILGTNSPGASFRLTPPTGNASLSANSGAQSVSATTTHNYNGKIGFLHSGASEASIATAITTTGLSNIQVNYNVMTIRNPYDGTTNTRISESILQYRIGNTGNFTNITSVAYQTNTTLQTGTGVTTPQNLQSRSVVLPSICNNQPVVQLRWVSRDFSGAGNRPSIAIDDINIAPGASINTTGTLATLTTTYGTASTDTSFNVSASALTADITVTPPVGFEVSTSQFSGYASSLTLTQTGGSIPTTTVYVRLSGVANAGNYSGNIVLSSGTTTVNVATAASTINTTELTITGISIADKTFDGNTNATITGTAVLNGVVGSDDVTLSGTPIASFADPAVGNSKPVTVSGYTITGASTSNYFLTQPSGLTGNILPSGLSDQTITFNPLSPVTYGDSSFVLTATSDSGLPVSYSSSNTLVATILGNVVTIVGAGTTTITASQAGDSSYNPALPVDQNLLVNTKELTISSAAVSDKSYDGTTSATLTGTLTGIVGSDDVTVNLIANFADALVGTSKPVTSSSTLSGTATANYFLTQPVGLTASIFAVPCSTNAGVSTWTFGPFAGAETAVPTVSIPNVTVSSLVPFNNNGTTTVYLASGVSSTGYAGASGTINASMACFTGALNTATSSYHEFTITPQSGFSFSLNGVSFGSRSSGTGPQLYSIRTNLDGYASNIASGSMPNNSNWALYTSSISGLSNITTPVTIRIYGSNGTGAPAINTSNWRIDDVTLNVTSTPGIALSSPVTASACSGENFNYAPTTNYSSATITWTRAAVTGIANAAVTTPQSGTISEVLVNTTSSPVDVTYSFTVTTNTCFLTQDVTVTVYPTSSTTTQTACDSYTWAANGTTYTASGTYTHVTTNAAGCPDTATLVLTINNSTSSTTTQTACDSYTWAANGTTYTASGTYTHVTTNAAGCPDTATLVLTINNSTSSTTTQTACDSYTWAANGTTYTASGTYTHVTTNAAGCPDTATLVLTINNSTSSTTTETACDSYTWAANGTTYTASGTYTHVTTNAAGCPDTATLVLTINNSTSSTTTETACDSYTWAANGTTYTASGTYTHVTTNAAGCPDTATLVLTINSASGLTISSSAGTTLDCNNPFTALEVVGAVSTVWTQNGGFFGTANPIGVVTFTTGPVIYGVTATDANGCSTTRVIVINMSAPTVSSSSATACDSYTWAANNQTYTASGAYTNVTTNPTTGCTSTVTLNLTINNSTSSTTTQTACDSYTWAANNQVYTASGTYTHVTTNAAGCPDTATLVLTINNSTSSSMSATACDSYTWAANGTTYTASGTYTHVTTNAAGCPDTATLVLTINNSTSSVLNITSSTPYTWAANGVTYSTSGTYTFVSTNAAGCPFTQTLNLVIATGPTTTISPAQCGITFSAINSQILANLVAGAQGYRWEITDTVTNQVQLLDTVLRFMYLTNLPSYAFNRTYSIRVAVRIAGVWQAFGTPCSVTTPVATTQVQASQCGSTLNAMNQSIVADNVPFATGYRFRITNLSTSVQTIADRPTRSVVLTAISGFTPEFNTTYSIEVAVRNTDGTYMAFGNACNVTTPSFPTTQLQTSQCDVTISNLSTTIFADAFSGASTYRFRVTSGAFVYTFDRPTRSFVLNTIPGLAPGNVYSIQVALEINGVFGPYGKVCTITIPGPSNSRVDSTKVEFQAIAYPNPYAESFMLDVKTATEEVIEVRVYDMLGKLVEDRKVDVNSIASLEIGSRYPSGVYNVIVSQGESIKTLRVVKR